MSPLTQRKLAYGASIIGAFAAMASILWWVSEGDPQPLHLGIAGLVCLIPGRINGWLWRDLYRGRNLLALERYAEAEAASTRALEALLARPWIAHARWFVGMVHTRHPGAMALNNRGIARMALRQLDRAGSDLREAVAIDPTYAVAHANLAGLLLATGDLPESDRHREAARAIGLRDDQVERALQDLGGLLARVEGRVTANRR